jgi:hypothetical protein
LIPSCFWRRPGKRRARADYQKNQIIFSQGIEEDLVDQLFNSSAKRLAQVLLLLANFGKGAKPEPAIPKLNQETLAEIVGTTRSRVSYFMNRVRKLCFIEYNGGLEVHSSLLNVILYD